jgi:hypothetical protein
MVPFWEKVRDCMEIAMQFPLRIKTLPIERVEYYVDRFIEFAKANPSKQFQVTRIGCGLAGFRDEDIAPMFLGSPENVFFDSKWAKFGLTQSWGTFG